MWDGGAVGAQYGTVGLFHYVQDYRVVPGIGVVSVSHPVGRADVKLYVARPEGVVNVYFGIEDVRASVVIVAAIVYYGYFTTFYGGVVGTAVVVLPEVGHEGFVHMV